MYVQRPSSKIRQLQTFSARPAVGGSDRSELLTATVDLTKPEAVVDVRGELDASTTSALEEALYACHLEGCRTIRIGLSGLELLAAAGLDALAREAHVDLERGGLLSVDHTSRPHVRRVLDMFDVPWHVVAA